MYLGVRLGDSMLILNMCTDISVLGAILFIKKLVRIISIIVPVLLVLFITVDLVKGIISNDENNMKKSQSLAIKRLIIGLIVFFIPMIVDTTFELIGSKDASKSCYSNANDTVIETLRVAESEKIIEKEADKQVLIEAAKESKNASEKKIDELRAKEKENTSAPSNDSNTNIPNQYVQAKKIAEAARLGPCQNTSTAKNCKLGDQNGKEIAFSKWRKGWDTILRPADPVKANKAALCMEHAVNNDNIGYGRTGYSSWSNLYKYLQKKKNFDPAIVTEKTSVSCCPLVGVCLKYAGYNIKSASLSGLGCNCNDWEKQKSVKALGKFTVIKSRNLKDIRRGDILIKNCNHMAMAV